MRIGLVCIALVTMLTADAGSAFARDWYVSAARGKGKKGTKEKPAKDLGNIVSKLKAGDTVHIAAGVYRGKGDSGADWITVPVAIVGGYADDFSKRDPWGAHRTVFSGDNKSKNYKVQPRLHIDLTKYRGKEMPKIVVDGLVIDAGDQNRYKSDEQNEIVRAANPATGQNPTPSRGALVVSASKTGNFDKGAHWEITIANNVILNSAPTKGVLSVSAYKGSKVTIENNVVVNNTGSGIYVGSLWANSGPESPTFLVKNNTVLFTWKYDGMSTSYSGVSLEVGDFTNVTAKNNVFAFADRIGVQKSGGQPLLLANNIIVGNLSSDYYEARGDQKIALADIEDEAEYLHEDSGGNVATNIAIPLDSSWSAAYGSRVLADRGKVEASIKATNSGANALRGMLGLNQRAADIAKVTGDIWLNRMSIDSAIGTGAKKYDGRGASKP